MRIKQNTKFFIIFVIFVVSIALGLKRSGLHKSFSTHKIKVDDTAVLEAFKAAPNFIKVKMVFNVDNLKSSKETLSNIINKYGITKKHYDLTGSYVISLLEIPKDNSESILQELRKIQGLSVEKVLTNSKTDVNINVQEHLENKKLVKERIKKELANPNRRLSEDKIDRMEKTLTTIQTEIDSLSNEFSIRQYNKDTEFLFLEMIRNDTENYLMESVKTFVITTIIVLVLLILGFIFFYYMMIYIMKLMKKMGLRTSSGGGGKYSYNYGKYYGYGKRNKKIKRIYKDKPSSDDEEE